MTPTNDAAAADGAPAPGGGAVWPLDRVVSLVVDGAVAACSATELRVLFVLVAHADVESGVAWPSRATIANHAGVSIRSVTRALDALLARGWIAAVRRSGGRTVSRYRIAPRARPWSLGELVAAHPEQGHRHVPVSTAHPGHSDGPVSTAQPGQPGQPTGTTSDATGTSGWPATPPTPQTVHPPAPHSAAARTAEAAAIGGSLREHGIRVTLDLELLVSRGLDRERLAELVALARKKAKRSWRGLLANWLAHGTRWLEALDEAHHCRARRRATRAEATATAPVEASVVVADVVRTITVDADGDPRNPEADRIATRDLILERLKEHGLQHKNFFDGRQLVEDAMSAGFTIDHVEPLAHAARDQSHEPISLFWSWVGGAAWRGVLATARRAPSVDEQRLEPEATEAASV